VEKSFNRTLILRVCKNDKLFGNRAYPVGLDWFPVGWDVLFFVGMRSVGLGSVKCQQHAGSESGDSNYPKLYSDCIRNSRMMKLLMNSAMRFCSD